MGAITRSVANGITTSGVVLKSIINNDSMDNVTTFPSGIPADSITLISSQTASSSASLSFTSGITSTYKAYKFVFVNMHPSVNEHFYFNLSTDLGSNYNVTKTTTTFSAGHRENDLETFLSYSTTSDLAQSTSDQRFTVGGGINTGNDESLSGSFLLFNPSSTTYVKHFMSNTNHYHNSDYQINSYMAGYANTTSAVNAIIFRFGSGNIDAGTIYMYGIK